jgi:transposase-like protein
MSETKKRNTHLPEFKAKVGLEAVRGVKTVNQIAQKFGVHPVQVGQWKREIQRLLFIGRITGRGAFAKSCSLGTSA